MYKDFLSPAKLNLFLHLYPQKKNGYRQLFSLFTLIDFSDKIAIKVNTSGNIEVIGNNEVPMYEDLIYKAAQILKKQSNTDKGAKIIIKKKIPIKAGLGGGSSNAATTLIALNYLWELNFDVHKLAMMSQNLGSDIPFFIYGKNSFVSGRGEFLKETILPKKHFLVIFSGFSCSTAQIFNHQNLILTKKIRKLSMQDISKLILDDNIMYNDCLLAAISLQPQIKQNIDLLNNFNNMHSGARLTGSGSCIFAQFNDLHSANKVLKLLPENLVAFVASSLDVSYMNKYHWDVAKR